MPQADLFLKPYKVRIKPDENKSFYWFSTYDKTQKNNQIFIGQWPDFLMGEQSSIGLIPDFIAFLESKLTPPVKPAEVIFAKLHETQPTCRATVACSLLLNCHQDHILNLVSLNRRYSFSNYLKERGITAINCSQYQLRVFIVIEENKANVLKVAHHHSAFFSPADDSGKGVKKIQGLSSWRYEPYKL